MATSHPSSNYAYHPGGHADVDKEILSYVRLSRPSPAVCAARQALILQVSRLINSPVSFASQRRSTQEYRLNIFGSVCFGLDDQSSDLDLCIIDPDRPHGHSDPNDHLPDIYHMKLLAKLLRSAGCRDVVPISNARIPIVKFLSPDRSLSADLNTNNLLGCRNSLLLRAYHDLDPHTFRHIGIVVKLWAKSRNLCDPAGRQGAVSFSSYSLVLMVIGFLQSRNILPNLQAQRSICHLPPQSISVDQRPASQRLKKSPRPSSDSSSNARVGLPNTAKYDTRFVAKPSNWCRPSPQSLSWLLLDFFRYYCHFDFANDAVSISNGRPDPRPQCPQAQSDNPLQSPNNQSGALEPIVILDPFTLGNTARNIQPPTAARIAKELRRAETLLGKGHGLNELCGRAHCEASSDERRFPGGQHARPSQGRRRRRNAQNKKTGTE